MAGSGHRHFWRMRFSRLPIHPAQSGKMYAGGTEAGAGRAHHTGGASAGCLPAARRRYPASAGISAGLVLCAGSRLADLFPAIGAKAGETVLDLCAAPGGKTCTMALQMQGSGKVLAFDLAQSRVGLIAENVRRLGLTNVTAMQGMPLCTSRNLPAQTVCCAMCRVLDWAFCAGSRRSRKTAGRTGTAAAGPAGDSGKCRTLCKTGRCAAIFHLYDFAGGESEGRGAVSGASSGLPALSGSAGVGRRICRTYADAAAGDLRQ